MIDPLAMPVGADTPLVLTTLETIALIRDEFGVNMTLGASNVSFGMPDRHSIGAAFLPMAIRAGLTSAIMDARSPQIVRAVKAADLLLNRDEWGAAGSPRTGPPSRPAEQASTAASRHPARGHRARTTADEAAPGPFGSTCVFKPERRRVRVPHGVTLFDAASWNGIAIDSTCGGHGTCKKCKVRIADGAARAVQRWTSGPSPREELRDGWRLACRARPPATPRSRCRRWPPGPRRPPSGSAGRSSCARRCRSATWSWPSRPWPTRRSDLERVLAALDDLELRADLPVLTTARPGAARGGLQGHRGGRGRRADRVEPGDTSARRFGIAFDLGTTTVVATLLDLSTGTPVAVDVHAERPAAVRRRRDHPDQRHHDGPRQPWTG